jgi:hypothetical protein
MALENDLPIPGESSFPFAGMYKPPANAQEEGKNYLIEFILSFLEAMRSYLQQLRQELSARLIEEVYKGSDEPSKVCYFYLFNSILFSGGSVLHVDVLWISNYQRSFKVPLTNKLFLKRRISVY